MSFILKLLEVCSDNFEIISTPFIAAVFFLGVGKFTQTFPDYSLEWVLLAYGIGGFFIIVGIFFPLFLIWLEKEETALC